MAIMKYRDPLKHLLLSKARSDIVTAYDIGHLMWEYTNIRHIAFDYIVPIPLHWTRYAWRGFNQAEEMGKILAHKGDKPLVHLIKRKRSTPFQSSLAPLKRAENVKDVFAINTHNQALYHGKHLLLVDDLMTTGSTLKEAGKVLLKLKPRSITAVVACRVI
jgi:competence protein ComFC